MSFNFANAASSAVGSYGGGGSSSSGGGYDWISAILNGASSLAQGKIDRKALAENFRYQSELLQMSLDARREEQERARGYELEDRQYRQDAIGNYAQFAPRTGLLAQSESSQGSPAASSSSNSFEAAREYGLPENWQNGDPGNGAARAMIAHRQMNAAQGGTRPGGSPGGLMADAAGGSGVGDGQAWGGRPQGGGPQGPGGMGMNARGGGGEFYGNGGGGGFSGGGGPRRGDDDSDPYGGGGRPSTLSQYADEGAAFLAGGFLGPAIGSGVGAVVRGFNDPSNPYFGNGNFENANEVGRNFQGPEAPDQSRQRSNPVSNFLDWLRELIGNE